jgi:hypothetical protein
MRRPRKIFLWALAIVLLPILGRAALSVDVGMSATVISDSVSPDGEWDAMLIVRNPGAMDTFYTVVSVVKNNLFSRKLELYLPSQEFVADNNDGKVEWGSQGQLDVMVRWASASQLVVTFPEKVRVDRADPNFQSVSIRYTKSP